MSKGLKIFFIIFLSFITILTTVFFVFLLRTKGNLRFFNIFGITRTSNREVLNKTYDNYFESIKIQSKAAKIEVKESENNEFKVIIYSDDDNYSVKSENATLNVSLTSENECGFICFNNHLTKAEIYVPKTYSNIIDINNNYGDVKIETNSEIDLNANLDAGNISVEKVKNAKINNNYGNIKVSNAKMLEIEEKAGNVKVGSVNEIKVVNNLGNIDIEKVDGYIDAVNDCGNIKIDSLNIEKDSSILDKLGNIKINRTNDIFVDAKTDVGDLKVNNNSRESYITLTIRNNMGNIKVNN